MNKLILIGNVGSIERLTTFHEEKKLIRFSLATQEFFEEKPQWHSIAAWDKQAEILSEHLKVGSTLFVEGRLKYTLYTDKENVQRRRTEVVLESFKFVSQPKEEKQKEEIIEVEPQDLPF